VRDVEIAKNVYWIGVNDRTTELFEGLWPIAAEGVSYNAYLIKDEKNAIIDLSKAIKTDEFFDQIDRFVPLQEIDYIILNHMEPDHTGVLKLVHRFAPNATILGTPKLVKMLCDWYDVKDNVRAVEDGEELDLGTRKVQFFHAPFVHWPETMVTYDQRDKIVFSCDAFGSYGAFRGTIFDDSCVDRGWYEEQSLRYYANIVAKFSHNVLRAIKKLSGLDISIIAPSHGLVWREDPGRIVELYQKWASYAEGPTEPGVTLLYGSMYGNSEKMMNAVAQGISDSGLPVEIFDVARTHTSYILSSLWTQAGVMIGAPTYETNLFPPMAEVLHMCAMKRVRNKICGMFGSHGWSGGAVKHARSIVEPLKWDFADALDFTGAPSKEDMMRGVRYGQEFAARVKES